MRGISIMTNTIRRCLWASLLSALAVSSAERAAGQVPTNTWIATASGSWSTTTNWDTAPAAGGSSSTVLQFNNSGSTVYTATNDLGTFQLNGLILNSSSSGLTTL